MVDSVSRLNRVMEALRRQIADGPSRLGTAAKTGNTSQTAQSAATPRPSPEQLRQRIADRVRSLDPDDPRRPQKARRAFLESVIAWEFGDAVMQDRHFDELVDHIQQTFDAAPDVSRQLDELLAQMKGS